ncbi:hypothetical protein XH80_19730 [Bradyrhizobium sp. CCBAU 45384]|nr:hypothetical protein [Bradyrhizobium sp. CCBAU 45384]
MDRISGTREDRATPWLGRNSCNQALQFRLIRLTEIECTDLSWHDDHINARSRRYSWAEASLTQAVSNRDPRMTGDMTMIGYSKNLYAGCPALGVPPIEHAAELPIAMCDDRFGLSRTRAVEMRRYVGFSKRENRDVGSTPGPYEMQESGSNPILASAVRLRLWKRWGQWTELRLDVGKNVLRRTGLFEVAGQTYMPEVLSLVVKEPCRTCRIGGENGKASTISGQELAE